jgi:GNAT superfamily N-acetyltransferase
MGHVDIARSSEFDRIREFYEMVGYGGGVSAADRALIAWVGGRLAGAVRLSLEVGVIVLRGMQVAPAFQRQGVGRALLAECHAWLDRGPSFCLPYAHLAGFYGEAGFMPAPPEALPPFLAARLVAYLLKGQQVVAMCRPGADYMPNKSLASRMA